MQQVLLGFTVMLATKALIWAGVVATTAPLVALFSAVMYAAHPVWKVAASPTQCAVSQTG